MDISNDLHFKDFASSRNLRPSSVKEYLRNINQFCIFLNKNPTQLIEKKNSKKIKVFGEKS